MTALGGGGLMLAGIRGELDAAPSFFASSDDADVQLAATPAPATPLAETQQRLTVQLRPGLGNDWCIYNGRSADPGHGEGQPATIASVRNLASTSVTLNHWDDARVRSGPIPIPAGGTTHGFEGRSVAGTWEAAISGSEAEAPAFITLEIEYAILP